MTVQDNNFLILYSAAFLRQTIASKDTLIFSITNIQMHIIQGHIEPEENRFSIGILFSKLNYWCTICIYPADQNIKPVDSILEGI